MKNFFSINPDNGFITINNKYGLIPNLLAKDFLVSELYEQYSMDVTNEDQLRYQPKVLLNVKNAYDYSWYFALTFKNTSYDQMVLNKVRIYISRNSIPEIIKEKDSDLNYLRNLLNDFFVNIPYKEKNTMIRYNFPWGIVTIGLLPDGILPKIIVNYNISSMNYLVV
mgnify:CR=1 FL=1|jgi:hypothetical protein